MPLPIIKRAQAFQDLEDYALYIGWDNLDAAERFIQAAERTFVILASTPLIGPARNFRNRKLSGLRSWRIAGFENYLVFYRVKNGQLDILRIIHGAMDLEKELE